MVVPVHAMKAYIVCEGIAALILKHGAQCTVREWPTKRRDRFTLKESISGTHLLGGWVGPKIGLDILEDRKTLVLLGFEPRVIHLVV